MTSVRWLRRSGSGVGTFQIAVPDGWTVRESPGSPVTLLGPEVAGFRASLVVHGRQLPIEVDLETLAERALQQGDPDTVVGPVLDRRGGTRPPVAVRRGVATAGDRKVVQLVAVIAARSQAPAGLRSVYTLLGTCLLDRAAVDEGGLADTIGSFRTGPRTDQGEE